MEPKLKRTISVREMGQLLGLRKVESYWLVHKGYFDTVLIGGTMRVVIDSFEAWYASQFKYHKINGELPGSKLREESYSAKEIAELLEISEDTAYYIINRFQLPTVTVNFWKRVPKEDFDRWYASQTRYRTRDDREKDQELEQQSMTMPEMARLLDIPRRLVYEILKTRRGKKTLKVVEVAGKKRILNRSFQIWYAGQTKYLKPEDRKDHPEAANVHYADCLTAKKRKQKNVPPAKVSSNPDYLSVDEAALMAGADRKRIFRWIRGDRFPVVRSGKKLVRIPRKEFERYLSALHTMED